MHSWVRMMMHFGIVWNYPPRRTSSQKLCVLTPLCSGIWAPFTLLTHPALYLPFVPLFSWFYLHCVLLYQPTPLPSFTPPSITIVPSAPILCQTLRTRPLFLLNRPLPQQSTPSSTYFYGNTLPLARPHLQKGSTLPPGGKKPPHRPWRPKKSKKRMVLGDDVGLEDSVNLALCTLVGRTSYRHLCKTDIVVWVQSTWKPLLGYTPEISYLTRGWFGFHLHSPEDST
jgi:hypothetical protein